MRRLGSQLNTYQPRDSLSRTGIHVTYYQMQVYTLSRSAAILTLTLSRSSKFEVRSFESLNSGLRHGGLDPKSEVRPEALGAWFGRFD